MEQCDFNYHDILGSKLSCPCWCLRLVVIHNRKHVASSWLGYVGILKKCDCTSYHVEIRWTPQYILYHKHIWPVQASNSTSGRPKYKSALAARIDKEILATMMAHLKKLSQQPLLVLDPQSSYQSVQIQQVSQFHNMRTNSANHISTDRWIYFFKMLAYIINHN